MIGSDDAKARVWEYKSLIAEKPSSPGTIGSLAKKKCSGVVMKTLGEGFRRGAGMPIHENDQRPAPDVIAVGLSIPFAEHAVIQVW